MVPPPFGTTLGRATGSGGYILSPSCMTAFKNLRPAVLFALISLDDWNFPLVSACNNRIVCRDLHKWWMMHASALVVVSLPASTKSEACAASCTREILSAGSLSNMWDTKSWRSVFLASLLCIKSKEYSSFNFVSAMILFRNPGKSEMTHLLRRGNRKKQSARAP